MGVVTGTRESQLVLAVSLKLRDALEAQGITVIMTRTTQDVNVSNVQRALMANQAGADLLVRVHADAYPNRAVAGAHVLYPASVAGLDGRHRRGLEERGHRSPARSWWRQPGRPIAVSWSGAT